MKDNLFINLTFEKTDSELVIVMNATLPSRFKDSMEAKYRIDCIKLVCVLSPTLKLPRKAYNGAINNTSNG